jgi:peptidoglycan hydrolase-like protein with peptidoglycan-binding domain
MQLKLEWRDGKLKPVVLEKEDKPKRNSYVETLQACLTACGCYSGTVDGKFGSGTETAVKKFQKENGLKETGRVDPETAEKLDKKVEGKIESKTQAKEIEEYLGTDEEEEKSGDNKKEKKKKDDKKADGKQSR